MIIGKEMSAEDYIVNRWIKDETWKRLKARPHQVRFKIVSHLLTGESFMDVGCACGHSIAWMKKHRPGIYNWSGLDFSPTAIEKARESFPSVPFYLAEDFNLLPVCGKFDSVTCLGTIEHIEDDEALVKGLVSITNQTLVISTPARRFGKDAGHVRFYTPADFERLFGDYFYIVLMRWPHYIVIVKPGHAHNDGKILNDFAHRCQTLLHQCVCLGEKNG